MMKDIKDAFIIARHKYFSPLIPTYHVKVETSAECNACCDWCLSFKSERKPRGLMKLSDFRKFIDLNKLYFRSKKAGIMPFFRGECLIHPQIFEFLDYAVENKIRLINLDTNFGMHIDVAKLMSYPFESIRVNIGGTTKEVHEKIIKTDFGLVTENLKKALEINPGKITVKMQVNKNNFHQIKQVRIFAKSLGSFAENVLINTASLSTPNLATEQEKKDFFEKNISEEINEYLSFDYDLAKPGYGIRAKNPGCHLLTHCVAFDGKLILCCKDLSSLIVLGNAFEVPLYKIFSSKKYKESILKAKNMEFNICKECN